LKGKFTDGACISAAMKKAGVNEDKIKACMTESGSVRQALPPPRLADQNAYLFIQVYISIGREALPTALVRPWGPSGAAVSTPEFVVWWRVMQVDEDKENLILKSELEEKQKKSIVILPSIYVNNVVQRGGLSAVNVLNSICAGYLSGTQPEVCACSGSSPENIHSCVSNPQEASKPNTVVHQGVSWAGVLGIVALVVLVMTGAGFVYWRRTQEQMREQVRPVSRDDDDDDEEEEEEED
jgi:hypothetical protein